MEILLWMLLTFLLGCVVGNYYGPRMKAWLYDEVKKFGDEIKSKIP